MRRVLLPALALVLATVYSGHAAEVPTRVSREQIQRWVEQLNDDQFTAREKAAFRLAHAGPAAIAALVEGVAGSNPEVAWRSSEVLRCIAMEGDEATLERIVGTLDSLAKRGQPGLANFARQMRERQRTFKQSRALAEVRKHGGRITTAYGEEMEVEAAVADWIDVDAGFAFDDARFEVEEDFMVEEEIVEVEAAAPLAPPAAKHAEGAALLRALKGLKEDLKAAVPKLVVDPIEILPKFLVPDLEAPERPIPLEIAEAIEVEVDEVEVEAMEIIDAPVIVLGGFGGGFAGGGMVVVDPSTAGGTLWLAADWRGGSDGLKYAKDLTSVTNVQIDSAELNDAALTHFAKMPALRYMQIRGGKFSVAAMREFHRTKPDVSIMALGTGMMGVNGPFTGACQLQTVFPESSASEAGIQVGDVITKIDDDVIRDFSELTIAVSVRKPGDKMNVVFEREGKEQETLLTLKARAPGQ